MHLLYLYFKSKFMKTNSFLLRYSIFISFALILISFHSYGQGSVEWNGSVNNDWKNANNWTVISGTPMTPPSRSVDGDTVTIPVVDVFPVVMNGDSAFARKLLILEGAMVTVEMGGVLIVENSPDHGLINAGMINNNGKFTVDSSYMHGVINEMTGHIQNNGVFEILEGLGDRLRNSGTIINNASATFLAGGGIGVGMINFPDASITNSGSFSVVYSHEDTLVINFGSIMNNAGANFTIDGGMGAGTITKPGSEIFNAGTFSAINSNGTRMIIESELTNSTGASFFATGGNNGHGVEVRENAKLINHHEFRAGNIGFDAGERGFLLFNAGEVTNSDGSTITLNSSALFGLFNGESGIIHSEGTITSQNSPFTNQFAIINLNEMVSDTLNCTNHGSKGIFNGLNASLISKSRLIISGLNDTLFVNLGNFQNQSGAYVNLTNTNGALFVNGSNAMATNSGTMEFGSRGKNAFTNFGVFHNTATGHFNFTGYGGNHSIFNNGLFTTQPGGSITFNGNQNFAYIKNGLGDTLLIQVPVKYNAFGSGPMIDNDGYIEFYGGKQEWVNRTGPTIRNGENATFVSNDTFIVRFSGDFVHNMGKFTLEMGSYVETEFLNQVISNSNTGEFHNYADIKASSAGIINNAGIFHNYEGVQINLLKGGYINNASSGVFHNYGSFNIREVFFSGIINAGSFFHYDDAELDYGFAGGSGVLNTGSFANYGRILTNVSGLDSIAGDGVNNTGIFDNFSLIRAGQSSIQFGGEGVRNHGSGVFRNHGCGVIDIWEDNQILDLNDGFTNSGLIIENGKDNSNIATNTEGGVVINLNGGMFTIDDNSGTYVEGATFSAVKEDIVCLDCKDAHDDLMTCASLTNSASYEPDGFDPCSCSDPFNIERSDSIQFFHDYVQITDMLDRTWRLHEVLEGEILDEFGVPLPEGMMGAVLINMDIEGNMLPANTTRLDFYHGPGTGFRAIFSPDGGNTTLEFSNSCTQCYPIPNMGTWGLIILAFLVLIGGVLFAKYYKTQRAIVE